ncbi:MAG: protease modulator HflC [Verrucomicrobiota bacterium]|nr:protease modulator HflC [Verrucomicrobiota bacterium]
MSDHNKKATIHWPAMVMGVIVALIFIFTLITFQVSETECAIVTTFGKPKALDKSGEVFQYKPGLHLRWPYPIQRVWRHDNRVFCFEGAEGKWEEVQTKDGKNIIISIYCGWKVSNPKRYFERVNNIKIAAEEINSVLRDAKNSVIGKYKLSNLINSNHSQLKIEEVEKNILKISQSRAKELYGTEIVFLGINHLGFPETVANSVFERMKKERDRLAESYLAEGDAKATEIKAKADAEAKMVIVEAEAKARGIMAEGDMQAAKSYAVFNSEPQLAAFLRKLESLKRTISEKTTLIVDTNTAPYDLLSADSINIEKKQNKK